MLCLNVGCHDIHIKGFVNIDLDPSMKPDLLWDATKLREKYEDNFVDFIYCGHFLEHFDYQTGLKIITDFRCILRPYGSVIATIPDISKVDYNNMVEVEQIVYADGLHKTGFTEKRLNEIFTQANYTVINVPPSCLPWCRFPEVTWQSAVIAIKHDPIKFTTG